MSARTGWKRTADGRMMRSESAEDVMEEDEPSMLLDRVPAHVLREVFGFLGDSDLARAEATCATFRQASRSESLWRDKLADKLGDQAKIVLPEKLPHERYYHGDILEEPAWKTMFKFWMDPKPNSFTWNEKARGEEIDHSGKFAARYLHRCTAVGDGNKILLFGGQGSGADFFNDLHLLDLQKSPLKLEQLHASGDPPFPRCSGTLTTVSVAGLPGTEVVALFGGSQGFFEGFSNSLCILQGDNSVSIAAAASQRKGLTWEEPRVVAAKAEDGVPDARWGHSAVAWRGKLILFGGSNTQHCFNDTWVLDVSHEPERSAQADAADAAGVGDAAESRDAAARARTSLPSGTTRKSSRLVATWSHVDICESARPPSRAGQTVSLVGDSLYVFGGCHISDVFNDLWTLDLSTQAPVWRELVVSGTPPAPRVGHAAVVLGDRIVFSGGRGSPSAGSSGTFATADQGLATMQGLTFFEGGFAMLDVSRRAWMPIQHPIRGGGGGALALTAPRDVVGVDVDLEMADAEHAEHAGVSAPATAGGVGGAAPAEGGVWEHRTGHVMVPAKDGLLVIGGLAYNGEFQNDVQHIKVF